jgi:site-specific recombinase XerC
MENDNSLSPIAQRGAEFLPALCGAIQLWAESSTSAGDRYKDLVRDKRAAVENFFRLSDKHPVEIKPRDVQEWREAMEAKGLKPNTVYAHVSRLSSFYRWVMKDPVLGQHIKTNPVLLSRPKRPALTRRDQPNP